MASARVGFLIVGSPRSGTTLVQRLGTELADVAIPYETHFFTKGIEIFGRHGGFPAAGAALTAALAEYCALEALAGSGLDPAALAAAVDGHAVDALTMFDAVTAAAAGPARILGEKTPGHVFWAARLTRLRPGLRVVGVVRDPRAVVASRQEVPWGGRSVDMQATRWLAAQTALVDLERQLGDRMIVLRYEDVVADPDDARRRMAALLGTERPGDERAAPALGLDWEHWKARAGEEPTTERIDHWRTVLSDAEAAHVGFVCAPLLHRFGYDDARPRGRRAAAARWSRTGRRHRRIAAARLDAELRAVATADLGPSVPGAEPTAGTDTTPG
jgi:hypothetical protein